MLRQRFGLLFILSLGLLAAASPVLRDDDVAAEERA